jgi:hypothetical protein
MTRKEGSGLITAKGASRRPSCFPPETTAEASAEIYRALTGPEDLSPLFATTAGEETPEDVHQLFQPRTTLAHVDRKQRGAPFANCSIVKLS